MLAVLLQLNQNFVVLTLIPSESELWRTEHQVPSVQGVTARRLGSQSTVWHVSEGDTCPGDWDTGAQLGGGCHSLHAHTSYSWSRPLSWASARCRPAHWSRLVQGCAGIIRVVTIKATTATTATADSARAGCATQLHAPHCSQHVEEGLFRYPAPTAAVLLT